MSAIQDQPHRHPVTVEEYMRMGEACVFAPHMRLELMEGEIVEMAPIGSAHAAVVSTLAALFGRSDDRFIVAVQNPLVLDQRSAPQPDVVLLRARADKYYRAHPNPQDALLVVEVADTTVGFDLGSKVPLYASAGVVEVWVVDIQQRALHVFREPGPNQYSTCFTVSDGGSAVVAAFSDLRISVADLFPG